LAKASANYGVAWRVMKRPTKPRKRRSNADK
jgi:hypothetical protein